MKEVQRQCANYHLADGSSDEDNEQRVGAVTRMIEGAMWR